MPCEVHGNAIVCSRRSGQVCVYCKKPSEKLCDGPGRFPGTTCDRPLCTRCAAHVEPDSDYCREHRPVSSSVSKPAQVLCPACGGSMTSRSNRSTGQRFWGCDDYPRCRGTRNTDGD